MPAEIRIPDGSTPSVAPDTVSASNPQDVWLHYELQNAGDEDGDNTNYYYTIDSGTDAIYDSDFVAVVTIEAGGTVEQGCKVEAAKLAALAPGDNYWVTLRTESGETLGGARLEISP